MYEYSNESIIGIGVLRNTSQFYEIFEIIHI
jgi:hypothetical protein